MRQITLQTRANMPPDVDTLISVVRVPIGGPGRSTSLDDMRLDVRLEDALRGVKDGEFVLEDADWERLCAKIKAYPWQVSDKGVLAMCDNVLDAPAVSVHTPLTRAKSARSR